MLTSYLTTAFRNFKKYKLHSIISLIGLSVGIMASLLALIFVLDEQSFDKFHSHFDRLYRLNKISKESNGSTFKNAETSGLMGPTIVNEFEEVDKIVRYQTWGDAVVLSNKDTNIELAESDILIVDSTFFKVFDFELVGGSVNDALTRPSTMVLTEDLAKSLFGEED